MFEFGGIHYQEYRFELRQSDLINYVIKATSKSNRRTDKEGSRRLRLPDFMTLGT